MSFQNSTPLGPYYVHNEAGVRTRTAFGETFKLFISAAYNAMGLIGSEADGIVILNESRMEVVADQIERSGSGYNGPNQDQLTKLDELVNMTDGDFIGFLEACPRCRGPHSHPKKEMVQ